MQYQLYWWNWKLEKRKRQVLDENCSSDDKTWENLIFSSNDHVSHKLMAVTGLASLNCKATAGRHIHGTATVAHPLEQLHLKLRGKAKDVKFAFKKEDRRILISSWGSHASQPLAREGSHHRFWYTLFWACPWIDLQSAPSKLRRAKYAVKHFSTFANRNVGLGTASPHSK